MIGKDDLTALFHAMHLALSLGLHLAAYVDLVTIPTELMCASCLEGVVLLRCGEAYTANEFLRGTRARALGRWHAV